MKIGVVPNRVRTRALEFTERLVAEARRRGWEVWVDGKNGVDLSPDLPLDMVIATGGTAPC